MHPCVAKTKDSYIGTLAKPWFVAYGCFLEDTELDSHLSIKAMAQR